MMSSTRSSTMTTRTQVQESQPTSVRQLLRAYDVHQSGQEDDDVAEAIHHNRPARPTQPQPSQPDDTGLPSHLDDDVNTRRAVPVYRAVGDHTLASRPGGQNRVEGAFATFAFVGVYTMGSVNKLWRITGGRLNDRIFRYDVGGSR